MLGTMVLQLIYLYLLGSLGAMPAAAGREDGRNNLQSIRHAIVCIASKIEMMEHSVKVLCEIYEVV